MTRRNRLSASAPAVFWALAAACSASGGAHENLGAPEGKDATAPEGGVADGPAGGEGGESPGGGPNVDGSVTPQCGTDCDDDNPCTDDSCNSEGECVHASNANPCEDGNPCTEGDLCTNGVCEPGGNVCPCAADGDCVPFEDGNLCNGTLVCGASQECTIDPATVVTCATGGSECVKSVCQPTTGACGPAQEPDGTFCDDANGCTAGEACQAGDCTGGTEACCADGMDNDGDQDVDCNDSDCASSPECGSACPPLAPVDESPLTVQSESNAVTSTSVNGYQDDYVFNQAGDRKLGIRRNWGGAIVFFGIHNGSAGMNSTNTIDGNDTGREVQIALYDHDRWYQGCAWNASCSTAGTTCPETMAYFGWNPVQGGNRCNHGSGYEEVALEKGSITLRTRPLFWNPNWDRSDCQESCNNPATDKRPSDVELTQRVRFVRPDVVELSYKVTNLGDIDHKPAVHEFPTLYASFGKNGTPDLHRLFDSTSQEITTGWNVDAHGFRYQNFTSAGGWATLQNQNLDYGVGLYYEAGMSTFQAWNKAADPKFNNFRGLYSFPLRPFAQVRARSYLVLGSLASMGAQAQWLDNNLPPFGWLDSPAPGAQVTGTVSVQGWAMDNKAVSEVQMIIDGGAPSALTYGASRPDVCMVWPGYPACSHNKVGFQGSFNANALPANACGHVIEIRAVDNQGNARIIARQRFHAGP